MKLSVPRETRRLLVIVFLLNIAVPVVSGANPFAPQPFKLVIGTASPEAQIQALNHAFSTPEGIAGWLNSVVPGTCTPERFIGDWLRTCRNNFVKAENGPVQTAPGMSAAHLDQVVFMLNSTMGPDGGFAAPPNATLSGQINEYCLSSPTQRGFYFPALDNWSHGTFAVLCVTVATQAAQAGANSSTTLRQFYEIHIKTPHAAKPDGKVPAPYGVAPRDNTDATNVFPEAFTHTGLRVSAADAKSYQHKLYAPGQNIRVVNYWVSDEKNAWTKYNNGDTGLPPDVRQIFDVDPHACVDMMFLKKPGVTLPPDGAPPAYCLGRCVNPPIINTGE